MVWLDERWEQPSLSDHYLMQLTAEVANVPAAAWGKAGGYRKEHFLLKVETETPQPQTTTTQDVPPTPSSQKKGKGPPGPLTKEQLVRAQKTLLEYKRKQARGQAPPQGKP